MKRLLLATLLVCFAAGLALAQRTVSGTVTGDDGETLVGASVRVQGTNVGAVTDVSGKYTVNVPAGATTLTISYTGYTTQDVVLGVSNVADVVLVSGQVLSEAVVTALGITRSEKALGYSVSKVEGSTVSGSGEVNAIQGLAAKTSGVQVIGSGGTPGASSKILIRGNSSFQLDNQPLIVIDNVPYDNQVNTVIGADYPFNPNLQGVNESNRALDINPDDIENISVLKGPSASALYGTRAANGVILITTKKGAKGRLRVGYGLSYSFDQVNKLPDLQEQYGQGNGGGLAVTDANGTIIGSNPEGAPPPPATTNSWGPSITNPYDNMDTYFQNGTAVTNNLSLSGGNENTSFRFSYGNTNQSGVVPNTELKRNTFRINASTGIDKFKISVNAAYTTIQDRKAQNGSNLSGVMLALTRTPPDFDILGGTGPNGFDEIDGSQHRHFAPYDNPMWSAYHNPNNTNLNRLSGAVAFDYLPIDWLTLTFRIGTDMYGDKRKQIWDITSQNFDPRGEIWESTIRHEEINTDFLARINKRYGNFSTALTVGTQLNHRTDEVVFARGTVLAAANYYNLKNASIFYADNEDKTRRIAGVFGTVDIGYKDFVYLTIGGRNDWASTFGPRAQNSFFYPNASLSFVLTELMEANEVLSYLKFRASYAEAGREPNPYTSRTYFGRPTFTDGFTNGIGFPYLGQNGFTAGLQNPNILGNELLRPEINKSWETGLDIRMWRNRLRGNFTYYYSKSVDLLMVRPIAATSGYSFYTSNVGEMVNKGIEIDLDYDIISNNNFTWTLGGNFTKNNNEVTKLAPGVDRFSIETAFTGIGSYAIVGQPYGAIFGSQWVRDAQGRLIIGENGLPSTTDEDGFLGNPYPDFTAAVRTMFKYKGISLSGLLDIREGGALWNGTYARLNNIGATQESADGRANYYIIDGVKQDGSPNDIRISAQQYFRTFKGDSGDNARENAIQDGSWIRLREVTLGYDLPRIANFVEGVTIYFTGRNLWLNTDYKGVDPETSLTGAGSNVGGFDYFNMPGTKSYIVGLRAKF
ncbi:MAG TPA: SusC/RagA family TonB-linked outer membrane protein [Saprospiraceae bacterium]|nr:SusC/RagA family TonB-linked outer membrane protein [Saprospiraceae bacterium]